ncbi:hypothetical protein [Arthrobacter sp. M4]|uniref:hypothetical protein n=1 Tax=Arthrobacter sp. M4 TaxID=218160 RepID=UPI001CDC2E11|nr:hypothetical protein [Arthrobacter sp. M4]MCA4132285.1 hypothetical protein [Arthrobacter sp. M4]
MSFSSVVEGLDPIVAVRAMKLVIHGTMAAPAPARSTSTRTAEPNIAAAFRRTVLKAPSNTSPNISGLKGTTPGFGGGT